MKHMLLILDSNFIFNEILPSPILGQSLAFAFPNVFLIDLDSLYIFPIRVCINGFNVDRLTSNHCSQKPRLRPKDSLRIADRGLVRVCEQREVSNGRMQPRLEHGFTQLLKFLSVTYKVMKFMDDMPCLGMLSIFKYALHVQYLPQGFTACVFPGCLSS